MKQLCVISMCIALVSVLTSEPTAHAALGGSADTVEADRSALLAVHRATTSRTGYSIVEITSDSTTVREFVATSGVVFGIAWNGYTHPDLTQLLGSYSGEYTIARQKAPRSYGRKRQETTTGNIVVEKWGHMRNLRGRAYVPNLVPSGVSLDEIN